MSNSNVILYALSCNHAAPGPATLINGELFCVWCQQRKTITNVIQFEWRAVCHNCAFSRWTGLSQQNAKLYINRHVMSKPAHKGHVEYSRNPEAATTARKMQAWNGRKTTP